MVIPNRAEKVWLHTKAFYPNGIYRLLTGGLNPGEAPYNALQREVKEETGFEVDIDRCLAIITYTFFDSEGELPFVSYVFLTTSTNGSPSPTDSGELISDFKAISVDRLTEVAGQLRAIKGDFADWGKFRAIAHDVTHNCLA
jgi:8-oxo-dGTP pyrophosphatase MutT (NUDIX family)